MADLGKRNIRFLSTLSLRRATDVNGVQGYRTLISIHALLAESDVDMSSAYPAVQCISIHALLAESDTQRGPCSQSHHPISIHALLAESDHETLHRGRLLPISIHALLAESDALVNMRKMLSPVFLSTLSLRRATACHDLHYYRPRISIHALLAESDTSHVPTWFGIPNFYPRSPCGERPIQTLILLMEHLFLSTLSLRRATTTTTTICTASKFLSTLSLRRATC